VDKNVDIENSLFAKNLISFSQISCLPYRVWLLKFCLSFLSHS